MDYRSFRTDVFGLRENTLRDRAIPESLVQSIWQHQRINREQARCIDGTSITILHPGFLNLEAGPDFKDAIIRIGDNTPIHGDIEIDLAASGWRAHGHDQNPAFRNVILRIVWEKPKDDHTLPLLHLQPIIDSPIEELSEWLSAAGTPDAVVGNCCAALRTMEGSTIERLLEEASLARLEAKAKGFAAGLWPRLFAALGYKNNPWPMFRIGELANELRAVNPIVTEARILGVSGLLPRELPESCRSTRDYVRNVWNEWWRQSERLHPHTIPASAWKLGGIRPANHPLRRMALAAHWLQQGENLLTRIHEWSKRQVATPALEDDLLRVLSPSAEADSYWENHWNFTSQPMKRPQPLLGRQRLNDIVMNVILPWLLSSSSDERSRERVRKLYLGWPAGESNSRLRMAGDRLLGGEKRRLKRTAAIQQGMLQIESDFCNRSNALCEGCRFPEFVNARDQA